MKTEWCYKLVSGLILAVFAACFLGGQVSAAQDGTCHVYYSVSAGNGAFGSERKDGKTAGVEGSGRQLEAMQLRIAENGEKLTNAVSYKVHVQGYGWMSAAADGDTAGTIGENRRMEAVQISLSSKLSKKYNIYYRVYVGTKGWLGWARDGQSSGTSGMGLPVEAIQVKLVRKGEKAPGSSFKRFLTEACKGRVTYQTYVEDKAWTTSVADGQASAASGQKLRTEAICIWLDNPTDAYGKRISGDLEYSIHVQGIGWQNYVKDGTVAGAAGSGKRMEAIRIRLTGKLKQKYDVYYRVRCSDYGQLGYAKNGQIAGTVGCAKKLESIEIKLISKGNQNAPRTDGVSYVSKDLIGKVTAKGYVQGIGWQDRVPNGGYIGTTGQGLRLEAMKLSIDTKGEKLDGAFCYSMYVQGIGWTPEATKGRKAGTTKQNLRAEAVKISLNGELGKYCDVWYRAYIEEYGWLGWAKNGQEAGTKNIAIRLEALQILVLPKGVNAPGKNKGHLMTVIPPTGDTGLYNAISTMPSETPYIIVVDTNRCIMAVYQGAAGRWKVCKQYICGPGKPSSPTVKGQFKVQGRGISFGTSTYTCWYYTQFYGDYLFHSVLYQVGKRDKIVESGLGHQVSHGCVRLSIEDAKWIYDNIPNRTTVYVY